MAYTDEVNDLILFYKSLSLHIFLLLIWKKKMLAEGLISQSGTVTNCKKNKLKETAPDFVWV